jgi:hypothetical protein
MQSASAIRECSVSWNLPNPEEAGRRTNANFFFGREAGSLKIPSFEILGDSRM